MDKFQVGDKVYDILLQQWGTVTSLKSSETTTYPVNVIFHEKIQSYTEDGYYFLYGVIPQLYFQEFKIVVPSLEPKWRAEPKCKYYFVESTGVVFSGYEYGNIKAGERFQVGNYFKSEKEAKESKFYEVFHESTSLWDSWVWVD